ncbi:MAG: alanine racemase [Planctomycetota bacterium]
MGTVAERVWAEVDLAAIAHNLRYAQVRVGQSVGVMAVVKSDAYGHGAAEVGHAAVANGASALGVATVAEAIELRDAGLRVPILVLGSCFREEIVPAFDRGVSLSISPGELFWPMVEAAEALDRAANVHLLVDTGMSRDGVPAEEAVELAEHIEVTPRLHLEGTYTHLATASLADKGFCREQLTRFNHVIEELLSRGIHPGRIHAANSSALFTLRSAHFDMVRQGLTLYGLAPSEHVEREIDVIPAMSVRSRVIAVKQIDAGESVGYGRDFVAARPTRLATVAMGYADGLRIRPSGRGRVLINGRSVPLAGRVMMDCAVADVTGLPGVQIGDPVTILGKSGRQRIGAEELAERTASTVYQVVCSFGHRVGRTYVRSGKRAVLPDRAPGLHLPEPSHPDRPPIDRRL